MAPNAGEAITVRFAWAVSLHPAVLVATSWYVPATVILEGFATEVPPTDHEAVKPVVVKRVFRLKDVPEQIEDD